MRLNYSSPLLFLLLLVGCSKADQSTEIPEGRLELVWAVQPEEADEEPWFGDIRGIAVSNNSIFVQDWGRPAVLQLDHTGQFIRFISGQGGGPGEFGSNPWKISVSPSGFIYLNHQQSFISKFSSNGEFLEKKDYRLPVFSSDKTTVHPFALDDSTIVWETRPSSRPNLEWSIEEYLEVPRFIVLRSEESIPIGFIPLNEEELNSLLPIISKDPRNKSLKLANFTRVRAIPGLSSEEILVVKYGNPYTVHRIHLSKAQTSFTYDEVQRDKWVHIFEISNSEFSAKHRLMESKYLGEYWGKFSSEISTRYDFTHTQRGIASYEENLVILVEILTDDFQPGVPEGGFEQYIYLVDRNTERAVIKAAVDPPMLQELHGVLEDGTLIFSTNDPVPGILAYRIIPN